MKKKIIISIIVLLTFIALRYLKYFYGYVIFDKESWNSLDKNISSAILNYSQIIIVIIVTGLLFKTLPFNYLGLKNDLLRGLLYGFIFTLPMFIGYGFLANFQFNFSLELLHKNLIMAGFFEELIFRGFLFGILYYYGGWGFLSAIIIPSVFFGLGHLYQAESVSESITVFLFTALGSAGFAWFYLTWGSLWMVIFLHSFMDLAWDVFSVQANAAGDLNSNIFRFITLGLVVVFSIIKAKKENTLSLKGKLWVNNTP